MAPQPRRPQVRFWEKVDFSGECWPWSGFVDRQGYGVFREGAAGSRNVRAHRFAWETTFGPIPHGFLVCHRCDNPSCVNPSHLFLGTPSQNTQDMLRKRRNKPTIGARNAMATLDEKRVREIVLLVRSGELSQREIGSRYGITQSQVSRLASGKRWPHITKTLL